MSKKTDVSLILNKKSPQFGFAGNMLTFDCILENTLNLEVKVLGYPVEKGVTVNDTKIIMPKQWTVTGAVSNNPLGISATDFTGAVSSLVPNDGILSSLTGVGSGFLAGSDSTRSATALIALIELMQSQAQLTVLTNDIKLENMTVISVSRTQNPENENGLVFQATLQELITLDDISDNSNTTTTTRSDDPAAVQAANKKNIGSQTGSTATSSINKVINDGIKRFI